MTYSRYYLSIEMKILLTLRTLRTGVKTDIV